MSMRRQTWCNKFHYKPSEYIILLQTVYQLILHVLCMGFLSYFGFFVCFPIIIDLLNLYDEHLAQNQQHNGKSCVREKNSWWKRVAVAFFPLWSPCSSKQSATACTRWKSTPPSRIHTCILPIRNWCQGLPNNLLNIYIVDREWFA